VPAQGDRATATTSPGINRDCGFAEFLLTSDAIGGHARPVAATASIAALADAGGSAPVFIGGTIGSVFVTPIGLLHVLLWAAAICSLVAALRGRARNDSDYLDRRALAHARARNPPTGTA
jgi:hypothetical protein